MSPKFYILKVLNLKKWQLHDVIIPRGEVDIHKFMLYFIPLIGFSEKSVELFHFHIYLVGNSREFVEYFMMREIAVYKLICL